MEKFGIVRRIDDLGRIVIPREIRRDMGIGEGDPLEMVKTDEGILVRPCTKASGVQAYFRNLKESIREQDWIESSNKAQLLVKLQELEAEITAIGEGGKA